MMRAKRMAALLLMAIAAAALPVAAQLNLNPLVTVLASPIGPVPADCATGETTAALRVVIGEPAPEAPAAAPAPPPSSDLRSALRRLQTAAAGDNYAEFKSALAAAREAVAAFPPGGERNAANDAIAVYADVERLWDYGVNAATGAFFDATSDNGALLSTLNRYPGSGHALADATMEVGGRTVYPTREARQFLAGEGAKRLTWIGAIPPPTPVPIPTEAPLVIAHTPAPVPAPRIPKLRPQPTAGTPASSPAEPGVSRSRAGGATPPVQPPGRRRSTKPAPVQKLVPAPQPAPAPTPAPVVAVPAPAPVPVPAPVTATSAPSAPTPTSSAPPEKPEAVGGRINLLLALILIVVGLGVLIFLFRASD